MHAQELWAVVKVDWEANQPIVGGSQTEATAAAEVSLSPKQSLRQCLPRSPAAQVLGTRHTPDTALRRANLRQG